MKVKTSISLSSELISTLSSYTSEGNRSDFIEKAIWRYLELLKRDIRNKNDLELLDTNASSLNNEATDVLSYQVLL
jgi:hypothetical protein